MIGQLMVFPLIYPTNEAENTSTEGILPFDLIFFGVVLAIVGNLSNYLLIRGITLYKLGKIALLLYLQILIHLIYDIFIFSYVPNGFSIFGSILVITSSIICVVKYKNAEEDTKKEKATSERS